MNIICLLAAKLILKLMPQEYLSQCRFILWSVKPIFGLFQTEMLLYAVKRAVVYLNDAYTL